MKADKPEHTCNCTHAHHGHHGGDHSGHHGGNHTCHHGSNHTHGENLGCALGGLIESLIDGQLKEKCEDFVDQLKELLDDIQNRDKTKHPELECIITALKALIPAIKTAVDSLDLEGCSNDKLSQLVTAIEAAAKPIIATAKLCLQENNGSSEDLDSITDILQALADKLKKGCD